jgi:flagellar operon protein
VSQEWPLRPVSVTFAPRKELPIQKRDVVAPSAHGASSFQAELQKRLGVHGLTFSAHALERLRLRNIRLSEEDLLHVEQAIDKLAAKGGRESLVVYKDTAFVISIKNRTVITALDVAHMKDHVFTNIDSAVFA